MATKGPLYEQDYTRRFKHFLSQEITTDWKNKGIQEASNYYESVVNAVNELIEEGGVKDQMSSPEDVIKFYEGVFDGILNKMIEDYGTDYTPNGDAPSNEF